jgi:hypothetical protein
VREVVLQEPVHLPVELLHDLHVRLLPPHVQHQVQEDEGDPQYLVAEQLQRVQVEPEGLAHCLRLRGGDWSGFLGRRSDWLFDFDELLFEDDVVLLVGEDRERQQ